MGRRGDRRGKEAREAAAVAVHLGPMALGSGLPPTVRRLATAVSLRTGTGGCRHGPANAGRVEATYQVLERGRQRWRAGALVALGGILLAVSAPLARAPLAEPQSSAFEGTRLVIRDSGGRPRVMIGQAVPRVPGQPAEIAKLAEPEFGLFVYGDDGKELLHLTGRSRGASGEAHLAIEPRREGKRRVECESYTTGRGGRRNEQCCALRCKSASIKAGPGPRSR